MPCTARSKDCMTRHPLSLPCEAGDLGRPPWSMRISPEKKRELREGAQGHRSQEVMSICGDLTVNSIARVDSK